MWGKIVVDSGKLQISQKLKPYPSLFSNCFSVISSDQIPLCLMENIQLSEYQSLFFYFLLQEEETEKLAFFILQNKWVASVKV